ncbi:hypothetical protein V1281_000322 [Nitrobacteraceae bacterium AZCC 2161]
MIVGFLSEFSFAVTTLLIFGFAGGFLLTPFSSFGLKFLYLAAPGAGISFFAVGTGLLYGAARLPFSVASSITILIGISLTLSSIFKRFQRPDMSAILISGILTGCAVFAISASTIVEGVPSFYAGDGTDSINYSQVADYIRSHIMTAKISLAPYDSLIAGLLPNDPRLGSFSFVAFISLLKNQSGLFSFDMASVIAFTSGVLAVAGLWARSRGTLSIIVIGLSASSWFDYSRCGFLGKLLNYPLSLAIAGLLLCPLASVPQVACLTLLVVGIAALHSGIATALILITVVCVQALGSVYQERRILTNKMQCLNVCVIGAIATSGTFARATTDEVPRWPLSWSYIFGRAWDLDNQGVFISGFTEAQASALASFCCVLLACVAVAGFKSPFGRTFSAGVGALVLMASLYVAGADAVMFQLIGFFYPLSLVATAALVDDLKKTDRLRGLVTCIAIFEVAVRLPHLSGSLDRYAIGRQVARIYRQDLISKISELAKSSSVTIDVDEPQKAAVMRAEILRDAPDVRWSCRAWNAALLYALSRVPCTSEPERSDYIVSEKPSDEVVIHGGPLSLNKIRNR